MRRFVATLLIGFTMITGAHAASNDDIQQGIFDSYLKLALKGDVVAQYIVAQSYENGRGTEKNMDKAVHWYEMAAKSKYPLAVAWLDQRKADQMEKNAAAMKKAQEESKPSSPAPTVVQNKKAPMKKPAEHHRKNGVQHATKIARVPAPEPAARREIPSPHKPETPPVRTERDILPPPSPPAVVVRAPVIVERPLPTIKVMDALLNGNWKSNQRDAEWLPSAHAACLQSGGGDVVCFSQEFTRNVDNAGLTYNVKSVISGINNKEARFNLRYIYNVVDIAGNPFAQSSGMPSGINDMAVKKGWQEPGVRMECHMRDERSLTCTRVDQKMSYQFVRE
ncbi:MAG: tetratricopeptide repeat protein [Sulfuricaulis sp.]